MRESTTTSRQASTRTRVVAGPVSCRAGGKVARFSTIDAILLMAGMAALASLLTSCASSGASRDGSEPVISSGLDALTDPGSKQPKLNRSAEIKRDGDEGSAYAKLADQATLDLNALLEARNHRKEGKAQQTGKGVSGGTASDIPARSGAGDSVATGQVSHAAASGSGQPAPKSTDAAGAAHPQAAPAQATAAQTPAEPPQPDGSWADDPARTIPGGERPRAASRFGSDGKQVSASDATRDAVTNREPKMAPTTMTATPPPEPAPSMPVFKGVNAALCTRVTGFGKLEAMPIRKGRNAFVFPAARVNRAIVYVELENFGYRAAKSTDPDFTSGDVWAVELSTEIQLLDDPDSILQFKERERTVIETGRNKRRDFYLVQEIELPPTLTVGAYNLKLILRDKSGAEPVRSEIVLPVQIVADVTASVDER